MVGAEPVSSSKGKRLSGSNLALRVLSALVLAPVALLTAWVGDWPFALFWIVAALAVLWEWSALVAVTSYRLMFFSAAGAVAAAGLLAWLGRPVIALLMVGLGALAAAIFAPAERRIWVTLGVGYAGAMLLAPMFLRADSTYGFAVIVLLFAIVWTTDVLGYFAGRAFGGPKLLPAVSPNKTWSGAIAGTGGAMVVALLVVSLFGSFNVPAVLGIAFMLSVVGQFGDLLEFLGEKAIWRQGRKPVYSRSWRRDGQARRLLGRRGCRLPDRTIARWLRWARARPVAMVGA